MARLPNRMTERVIRKLNEACEELKKVCEHECDDVSWCPGCWQAAFGKRGEDDGDEQA